MSALLKAQPRQKRYWTGYIDRMIFAAPGSWKTGRIDKDQIWPEDNKVPWNQDSREQRKAKVKVEGKTGSGARNLDF
jgi:hypothetical protein